MKEFRVILLLFFSVVTARMISETASCPLNMLSLCGKGYVVIIPFILSTYFVDSLMEFMRSDESKKERLLSLILCTPYIIFSIFVVAKFFTTISAVTIEYILSLNLLLSVAVYIFIYWLNNSSKIRKLNTVFMVTMLLSFGIFLLL